jgi:hypothetical protein
MCGFLFRPGPASVTVGGPASAAAAAADSDSDSVLAQPEPAAHRGCNSLESESPSH